MADQFYDDIPALANQITNDIDQMEKSLGFIKDVFQNFLVSFSNTDATVAFPANMELDPTPGSDHLSFGIKTQLVAGENVAFGDVCYLKSDGKLWIIDADAAASMPGIAMADATIAADATGYFFWGRYFWYCYWYYWEYPFTNSTFWKWRPSAGTWYSNSCR
jgi:hypothetical protein